MSAIHFFQMLKGAFLTLEISTIAIAAGLFFGTLMGIFTCQKLRFFPLSALISAYVLIMRGTPLFVQILIIYFGLPPLLGIDLSPFVAGVIALGANSAAYIAEIMRSGLNSIPIGQWEAAHVLGYSKPQMLRSIILPQGIKNILPALTNELIALIKESSILMVVGVPELTKVSKDIVSRELNPMETYLAAALFYLAMTSFFSFLSKKMEKKVYAYQN